MDEEVIYLLDRFPQCNKLLMDLFTNSEDFKEDVPFKEAGNGGEQ